MKSNHISRRACLRNLAIAGGGLSLLPSLSFASGVLPGANMRLGLVTYNWGKDWDVPTIIKNCAEANIFGVELRVEHAHGVGLHSSKSELALVKKMFDDSPVEVVGMGTNQDYDSPDPLVLAKKMEDTKKFIRISQAIGGSGVKVKPNRFHEGVPHEKTIEQIGKSLNELGVYAADFGQAIRLEVHGQGTDELPVVEAIMKHVGSPAVGVCWNCNDTDLKGDGLTGNFYRVNDRFGDTVHVRELNIGTYPYAELMNLLVKMDYRGWVLLECREEPDDTVAAMKEQLVLFQQMIES
jgi:sugar phosphate isomerase/epimerase